ncbi:MAG: protein phosphatase 2C domain-containing protein [Anaerolineales bacterium]|nr:protein phosphatase 2C domain-containing protein [Anaerolineales bacterium]
MGESTASQSTSKRGRRAIRIGMDQNIGASPKRRSMEDASFAEELRTAGGADLALAVVADGIGGASSGERASNLTVETIVDSVRGSLGEDFPRILETAMEQANRAVYEEAQQDENKRDMGSTAVAVIVHKDRMYLASVGDSRAYLIRENEVIQLTTDHNWGEEMIRMGKLRPQEAGRNPRAALLVRSIGNEPDVQADLGVYWNAREDESSARARQGTPLKPGDHILLCSDGLIKERPDGRGHFVETTEIPPIVSRNPPLQAARTLVSKAMGRNANDNVSAVVLEKPAGSAAAGKACIRWALTLALLSGLAFAGAALLPPLLRSKPETPVPPKDSILIGAVMGEALYKESGQVPSALASGSSMAVKSGAALQTLEGTVQFTLPDSSRVYLDRFSEVSLTRLADPRNGSQNTILTLKQGRLLIVASPPSDFSPSVIAPENLRAQVSGTVMGVAYDSGKARLEMDCLEGVCLIANGGEVLQLTGGERSWADKKNLGPIEGARYELWIALGGGDPAWVMPTATPTATATDTPTASKTYVPIRTTEPPPPGPQQPSATTEPPTAEPTTAEAPPSEPPTSEPTA